MLSSYVRQTNTQHLRVDETVIEQHDVVEFVKTHAERFGAASLGRREIAIVLNLETEYLRMRGLALPLVGEQAVFVEDRWGGDDPF